MLKIVFFFLFKSQNIPSSGMPKFHGGLMPPIPHHDPASIDCSTALLPYFYDFTSPPPPLSLSLVLSLSLSISLPATLFLFSSMFPGSLPPMSIVES